MHCLILRCPLWHRVLLCIGRKHFTHYPCSSHATNKDRLCSISRFWQGPEGLFLLRPCVLDGQLETQLLYQTNKGRTEGGFPTEAFAGEIGILGAGDVPQVVGCLLSILKPWVHPHHCISWVWWCTLMIPHSGCRGGRSEAGSRAVLHNKFKASLG